MTVRHVTQGEISAALAVLSDRDLSTVDLPSLLGSRSTSMRAVGEYFRGSAALSRAIILCLLARMADVPTHEIDPTGVDRALSAYRTLGSLPARRENLGSGEVATLAALLRDDAISEFELARIFGVEGSARSSVREKLEAARSVGVLHAVIAIHVMAAAQGKYVELADILRALAAPRYAA